RSYRALSSDRHRIHLNLVIALLLAQILFLTGIKATEHETLCKVIAGVLHYLYMVSFTWMLIEGVHLYLKVVKVFGIENIKIRQYYIIGWGLPALIVGVAAIIKPYGYGTNHVCWLSLDDGFVWAFLGPVIAIIAINIFILAAVIKTVVASASTMKSSDHSHIIAGIKGALVLMPLMGTTWVFGLLAVNRDTLIFQYIFSIANSLQGLLIFLLHVVFNNEVRLAFRRHYEKKQLSKESGDYNNSMSHSNESDNKLKTLGKSSSNSSMSGLVRLKARLSMSLMPRTSRVVTVQPINSIDKDDGLQVNRKFHQKSPSSEVSGLNSPSELDSYSKPPLHNPLRKGKNAGSRL
ncbi:adhesion G-protein coupled receptor D1, partial [Exaiptasia diaphana]|uniref:G-protein coupled receptors family 2 profile 2 domain-containing protein n=1 Tax=Exaiptasia diaphana TaxID=2652724 RepID=A0A913YEL9_EXADI